MERRRFIKLSALSAGAFTIPFIVSCNNKAFNPAMAQPLFLSGIFDAKTMKTTGEAYAKQYPAEDSRNKLIDLLSENSGISQATDAATVHSYYAKKTTADFEALKTVIVNGWVLAVTEARQCALFSLTQK
ncbi:MAG TPA: hypothetical protein VG738_24350 [Chitinophagaceae bacterium]|nr:hypothetical protein [Chitinophagaceae bacterium]